MTREEILRLAKQSENGRVRDPLNTHMFFIDELERFAALVAAAEREACANILAGKITRHEQFAKDYALRGEYDGVNNIMSTMWKLSECADAIRARGKE